MERNYAVLVSPPIFWGKLSLFLSRLNPYFDPQRLHHLFKRPPSTTSAVLVDELDGTVGDARDHSKIGFDLQFANRTVFSIRAFELSAQDSRSLPAPRRIRDRDHVKSVAKLPCLVCGRIPADAHHLRFAQSPALGRKVSDEFTIPLCRGHHREVHHCGDEAAWWNRNGVDPTVSARALWLKTHPLPAAPVNIEAAKSTATIDRRS